jgi:TorA maturation chaperone TorD
MGEPGLGGEFGGRKGEAAPAHAYGIASPFDVHALETTCSSWTADNLSASLDDIDAARGREYALLALLLSQAPTADLLSRLGALQVDPSPLGLAHAALGQAARDTDAERVGREYFDLFIGLGRGELLPYGSYYLTGFLHERPLARLRNDLAQIGITRAEDNPEPEDHAAILCEIMSGVIGATFEAPVGADRQIFEKHMAPWIGRFFGDLERAEMAQFYRAVGTLGRTFIDIETQAFALPS